jgi:hypothetical protein
MPPVDARDVLSPYVGRVVRCRGTIVKDEKCRSKRRTLVYDLDAFIDGAWVRAGHHCWVFGSALCDLYGVGSVLEFDAKVQQYTTAGVVRYAIGHPRQIVRVASADAAWLANEIAWLVYLFGWGAVADAVEKAHVEQGE